MKTLKKNPTIVIYNGKVFLSSYRSQPKNTAIAIAGNRIVAVGADTDILSLANSSANIINARNRWILPAFMDSHTHLSMYASRKFQIDFTKCQSLQEALERIKIKVSLSPTGSWITGHGWVKEKWRLSKFPDKKILDEISRQHFLAFQSKDCHSLWVNNMVLKICGLDVRTTDPAGGRIYRYPKSREPTGILQENACQIVFKRQPPVTPKEIFPALQATFKEFHRCGITSIHSVETGNDFANYNQLYNNGNLGLRVFWYFPDKYLDTSKNPEYQAGQGNGFLKICGVKMFADGALGSQTALMLENYDGLVHKGVEVLTTKELEEKIRLSVEQNLCCAIHAIGDQANRNTLQTFGKFKAASKAKGLRHRIEHAQLLHPEDIPLFGKYSIIPSAQPIHLSYDIPLIKKYWEKRGRYAYAFHSLLKHNANLIFGSDTPIETFDPWKGIFSAVARKHQCDPTEKKFYPEESIEVDQAVMAYTLNSAFAVGEENHLGSLQAGKLADLIIIDRDIFREPEESLLKTRVILTIQNGKIVYQSE